MYQCFKTPEGIWGYGCNLVIFNKSVNEGYIISNFDIFAYSAVESNTFTLEHNVKMNHTLNAASHQFAIYASAHEVTRLS